MAIHGKKIRLSRTMVILAAVSLLIAVSIGTTIAYLVTETASITNVFTPSEVETSVTFSNDGGSATVNNVGDTGAFIRAAVVVNWKKTDGSNHYYAVAPVEGTDYEITFNDSSWIKKDYGDGEVLYYHRSPVMADGVTDALFTGFAQKSGVTAPEGYELVIEVLGSGIQSTPYSVVEEKWGVTVGDDGNISTIKD